MNFNKIIFTSIAVFLVFILSFSLYNLIDNYYIVFNAKSIETFQDGKIVNSNPDYSKDIKKIIKRTNYDSLVNYPSGYSISYPNNMNVDLTLSPDFVRIYNANVDIKASLEYSPYTYLNKSFKKVIKDYLKNPVKYPIEYTKKFFVAKINKIYPLFVYEDDKMEGYFNEYLLRFIADKKYQADNSINVIEDKWIITNNYKTKIFSFNRAPALTSTETMNYYSQIFIITGPSEFYSFIIRSDNQKSLQESQNSIINSFDKIKKRGKNSYNIDFKPELPKWNSETSDFYNKLNNTDKVIWGYFYPKAIFNYSKVENVENQIDYNFPLLLHYINIGEPFDSFPLKGMEDAYNRGQVVELTAQISFNGNDNSPKHNSNFDYIDGKYDEQIRQFAQEAKGFKHPFLFRLNNEMNTDWCQYSGILLLSDPDMYIKIWQRIYDIFEEEGVDNAIWIFNPHFSPGSPSFPPTNWNGDVSYYPGNKYVQMLGITGYNNGTYLNEVTGETWRDFDEIYKPMVERYQATYGNFPWIIAEFASSSVGGDKEKWITDMFKILPKYKNIKAAVWWSYYDPDYRYPDKDIPARRYWLDEKIEYLDAFKKGVHAN